MWIICMHNNASEILFCPIGQKGLKVYHIDKDWPLNSYDWGVCNDILWWDQGLLCTSRCAISFYFSNSGSKVEIETVVFWRKDWF